MQRHPTSLIAHSAGIALFFVIGAFYTYLFYPGTIDWDTASIADMAATATYATWFPPAFTFLWRITDKVGGNPATIWLLQIALMLSGLYLLAAGLAHAGKFAFAALVPITAIAPPPSLIYSTRSQKTLSWPRHWSASPASPAIFKRVLSNRH